MALDATEAAISILGSLLRARAQMRMVELGSEGEDGGGEREKEREKRLREQLWGHTAERARRGDSPQPKREWEGPANHGRQ